MPLKDQDARRAYNRQAARDWRAANREKHRAYMRERYVLTDGAGHMREWRSRDPEKTKATARKSKATQKEKDPILYAYLGHKKNAKKRGNAFLLTFEEWLNIWIESGQLDQRGRGRQNYCMARSGDIGPYAMGNVRICTNQENLAEVLERRRGTPVSLETRQKMSAASKIRWARDR
jgi:hypothetical protein